ncbi:MAG: hypothetical protein Kow0074_22460 [Candidatus Zixiibacteriota bacterium]
MSEPGQSCVEPAAGPIEAPGANSTDGAAIHATTKERPLMIAQGESPPPISRRMPMSTAAFSQSVSQSF